MVKRFPLQVHADFRGELIQSEYPEIMEEVKHFLVSYSAPGVVRGNHYHLQKKEWFLVLQGEMELHAFDLQTNQKEVLHITHSRPELVMMEPQVVHAFRNTGKNELIFLGLVNELFDPEKPDTYKYTILE